MFVKYFSFYYDFTFRINKTSLVSIQNTGGRPDEAAAEQLVGHAGARPHPPAVAQRAAGRHDAPQRAKV